MIYAKKLAISNEKRLSSAKTKTSVVSTTDPNLLHRPKTKRIRVVMIQNNKFLITNILYSSHSGHIGARRYSQGNCDSLVNTRLVHSRFGLLCLLPAAKVNKLTFDFFEIRRERENRENEKREKNLGNPRKRKKTRINIIENTRQHRLYHL